MLAKKMFSFRPLLPILFLFQGIFSYSSFAVKEIPAQIVNSKKIAPVTFIVIGDMPYSSKEYQMLRAPDGVIYQAIQQENPELLIHVGDLKSGGSACTDKTLLASKSLIYQLNPNRVVYTPGDNDWVDCDRFALPERFEELERLTFIRQHFYKKQLPDSEHHQNLDSEIKGLVRQSGLIENARWQLDDLYFATVHVPGTNNGRMDIDLGDVNLVLDEADKRDQKNELWLEQLFELASNAQGVVISFQADIYHPIDSVMARECTTKERVDCDGLMRIREQIKRKAIVFKKPVLIIHGDTNAYCFQQQAPQKVPNLWRLNALGDYKLSDVAKVTFNNHDQKQPFTVNSLLGGETLPKICDYRR